MWREALDLLPADTKQAAEVRRRIDTLASTVDEAESAESGAFKPSAGWIATAGLAIWKFKWVIAFVVSKGKIALFGLTKMSTLLSMAATVGVYWAAFGWPFATGLVGSIYLHEMGHVSALRRYGIAASAPMFIPGVGAFIRAEQHLGGPSQEARVGLAGPEWGLGVALLCLVAYALTGHATILAIARIGAWINLFNLVPIRPLDGGRGFEALSRAQRFLVLVVTVALLLITGEGMLALIAIVAAVRCFGMRDPGRSGDGAVLARFVGLLALLSAIAHASEGRLPQ